MAVLLSLLLALSWAARADEGFTLNAEVLERYGYTLEAYNAMGLRERRLVEEWIKAQEDERKRASAPAPLKLAVPVLVQPESQPAFSRLKRAAQGGGFDGEKGGEPGFLLSPPRLDVYGLGMRSPDGAPHAGGIRRVEIDTRLGALQAGTLGLDGRSPLVAPSPYVGLSAGGEGSGARLDYSWKAQAYMLGLGGRLYTRDAPELDQRIDGAIDSLYTLDPVWGIKPEEIGEWKRNVTYDSGFETTWMSMASAMGRVGRAYRLLPGVDVGWSVMGIARVAGVFPNVALDQSAGMRIKADEKTNVGVFAGVTQTPRLFGQTFVGDSLAGSKWKTELDPGVDAAPHASVSAWGKMPYLSNVRYELSAGQQWNPWTTVSTLAGGANVDLGRGSSVGVFGKHDAEKSAPEMEFSRVKSQAGVTYRPSAGLDLSASAFQDSARYGTATIDSRGVWLGLTVTETAPGARKGASVTMSTLFGGGQSLVSAEEQSQFVQQLQLYLDIIRGLTDGPLMEGQQPERAWERFREMWENLSQDLRDLMDSAWTEFNPGAPSLARIMQIKPDDIGTLNKFFDLVTDTRVLERLVVRYMRMRLLDSMKDVEVPLLGKTRVTAPMILAAAHAYGLSVATLPPLTERDAREHLDAFLNRKLQDKMGCEAGGGGTDAQNAHRCLMDKLPEGSRRKLEETFGDSLENVLKSAVAWPSDVIRREMNRLALQIILAAEALNELSVDKGERIGDHNVRALMSSFSSLDERGRKKSLQVLKGAQKRLEEELAEQDKLMREDLESYGWARLQWLHDQPAWPKNVKITVRSKDWPEILAIYGDADLFDFILRAKGKLGAKGGRVLITFDKNAQFGTTTIKGDPIEVRLGPGGTNLKFLELPLD